MLARNHVTADHTLTVLSPPPETIFWPSGLNDAEFTVLVWPSNVCSHSPVTADHTLTVLSPLPETIFWPSGLNDADVTQFVWPSSWWIVGLTAMRKGRHI